MFQMKFISQKTFFHTSTTGGPWQHFSKKKKCKKRVLFPSAPKNEKKCFRKKCDFARSSDLIRPKLFWDNFRIRPFSKNILGHGKSLCAKHFQFYQIVRNISQNSVIYFLLLIFSLKKFENVVLKASKKTTLEKKSL